MASTAASEPQIREAVRRMIVDLVECEPEDVTDSAHFIDDLDIDSLMGIELMVALDKRYRIDIPEEEFRGAENLDQVVGLVMKHLED